MFMIELSIVGKLNQESECNFKSLEPCLEMRRNISNSQTIVFHLISLCLKQFQGLFLVEQAMITLQEMAVFNS